MDLSKRQYLKAAGVSLTALSLGIGGTVASRSDTAGALGGGVQAQQNGNGGPDSGDRLDYETDDSGNIEFDYGDLSFETDDGDVDLDDDGVDFETSDGGVELTVNNGSHVDLEINEAGDVELTADGNSNSFEDDNDLEYNGDSIQLEWDEENQDLDVTGDVTLEWEGESSDFEYADDEIMIDYDGEELEYTGPEISLEWANADGGEDDFEARKN